MTKMTKTQRTAILDFHNGVNAKGNTMIVRHSNTIAALVREGWARRPGGMTKRQAAVYPPSARRVAYVTRVGLIAAGVDMDAIHTEALAEDFERGQRIAAAAPAHVRDNCPALPVGCSHCTAPMTIRAARAKVNGMPDPYASSEAETGIDPDPVRPMNDTVAQDGDFNDDDVWDPEDRAEHIASLASSYNGPVLDAIRDTIRAQAAGSRCCDPGPYCDDLPGCEIR